MLAVRQADAVQLAAREDAEQVRDRIVAEARSNPLALLELPCRLRPAKLAGRIRACRRIAAGEPH
jgi:hypothetical protein